MGQLADSRVCLHIAMYFSPTTPFLANTEFPGTRKPLLRNAPARSLKFGDIIIFFFKIMHPRDLFFSTDEIGCYLCRGLGGSIAVAPTMFMRRLWTGRLIHQGFQKQKRISFCYSVKTLVTLSVWYTGGLFCYGPPAHATSVLKILENGSGQWVRLACVCRMSSCCLPHALP